MPPFRPVDAARAGPTAVGILLPPGRRTLVVLRPRALLVDLVLAEPTHDGTPTAVFRQLGRAAAAGEAQEFGRALLRCADAGDVEAASVAAAEGVGFWLWVHVEGYALVVCARNPGEAYRPQTYATLEESVAAGAAVCAVLCPSADAECELYTNARHFGV